MNMAEITNNIWSLNKAQSSLKTMWEKVIRIWELTSQIAIRILDSDTENEHIADDIIILLENTKTEWKDSIVKVQQFNRNFEIIKTYKDETLTIYLQSKNNDDCITLNDLLPLGFNFKQSNKEFSCKHGIKTIKFIGHDKPLRGYLLDLLHEIGHSHQNIPPYIYSKENLWGGLVEIDVIHQAEVASLRERNAWAFALVQARKLEKMWFNVLSSFDNIGEISEYIGWNLASYDECLFYDMLDTFWEITPENIHLLQKALNERPLFNKKTKNIYQLHI